MAYITPKTNWVATDIPKNTDLNRIEGNTQANNDAVTQNTSDISDIYNEPILTTTKTFTGTASTFTSGALNANVVLPRGFYILDLGTAQSGANFTTHIIQVFINGSWSDSGQSAQIYSDGTNVRIFVTVANAGAATSYYKALA